ncbi:hypothetical protein LPJ63_001380 [Coemansia sp. RSA 2711]|nr:hypothetical protein LPJ63_001380 [Coemansia sp. RSA 2711]
MEADATRAAFDVDAYAAAAYAQGKSLEDLQTELSGQLQRVRRSLYSLINERYEDFLGLSTSLTGIDTTIEDIRQPLAGIKQGIEHVHEELQSKLEYMDSRLAYRTQLREKKLLLRVFIDLSQLLDRVAMVLEEAEETGDAEEYVKCLERAAVDLSQIRYFAKKGEDHPFVVNAQQRVAKIEQSLLDALGRFLSRCLADYANASDESTRLIAQGLRAYSALEEVEQAEAIIRKEMVQPYAERVFGAQPGRGMGLEPDKFAEMLRDILQFVETVGVPLAKGVDAQLASGATYHLGTRVFWREIATCMMEHLPLVFVPGMPDRFFKNYQTACEFAREFGGLFAFTGHLDGAPESEVLAADSTYIEFSRKWQLSAYFSIQKKLIIRVLDGEKGTSRSPEAGGSPAPPSNTRAPAVDQVALAQAKQGAGLLTDQATRAVWAMNRCWAPDVYLEPLASKCWQLTMQILMWYQQTADAAVRQLIQRNAAASGSQALESPDIDSLLHHVHDTYAMRTAALDQTRRACSIVPLLGEDTREYQTGVAASLESAVEQALLSLDATVRGAADYVAATIVSSSTGNLAAQLRRTTSQFRHTNRPPPADASAYVAKLFAPLSAIEAQIDKANRGDSSGEFVQALKRMLRERVCADISREFARASTDALATISKTEASLLRLRKSRGPSARADARADDQPVPPGTDLRGKVPDSDNDKIRRQVWLDAAKVAHMVGDYDAQPDREFASFVVMIRPLGI